MAKSTLEISNNDKLANIMISYLKSVSQTTREQLEMHVLNSLLSNETNLDIEGIKNKTLIYKANFGNTLKDLVNKKIVTIDKLKSAKGICRLNQTISLETHLLAAKHKKEICQQARIAIMNYLSERGNSERKKVIEEVTTILGVSEEEALDRSTESKYTLYKSIVGTQIAELINAKEITLTKIDKSEFINLQNKKNIKQTQTTPKDTKKKESNPPKEKESFITISNKKMLTNLVNYKKIKDEFNEKQKEEILDALSNCDSSVFERLCVNLICRMYSVGDECGKINGGVDDQGIDGIVMVKDPMGFPPKKLAVQCKCFKDPKKGCTPTFIKYFYGAMASLNIRKGFMITTGVFDEIALKKQCTNQDGMYVYVDKYNGLKDKDFGKHERMIICIDGKTLVEYLVAYQLGILFSDDSEILGLDDNYLKN